MATAQAYLSAPPTEVRPRLTKEQHDILERHFQGERKPNTATKKSIAESLEVPLEKINVRLPFKNLPAAILSFSSFLASHFLTVSLCSFFFLYT